VACNGHRSNPWFLDSLRTLLELSDGLASNAFGTHLGYAVALDKSIHWLNHPAEQNLSALSAKQAAREATEWRERERLSNALQQVLQHRDAAPEQTSKELRQLIEPYWGFAHHRDPQALRHLLSQPLA
jgi:hypothetical protein